MKRKRVCLSEKEHGLIVFLRKIAHDENESIGRVYSTRDHWQDYDEDFAQKIANFVDKVIDENFQKLGRPK